MSNSLDQTTPARNIREEFRADLDAFEALEKKLLADERRERARELTARFAGLTLQVGE